MIFGALVSAGFGAIISAGLGAILGSFAGVVAERLHTGQSWSRGRSRCSSCTTMLKTHELLPIVSYLLLLGRCRTCKAKIPPTLLGVEVALAGAFALAYLSIGFSVPLLFFFASLTILGVLVLYDMKHSIVPTELSILLFVFSFLFLLLTYPTLSALGSSLLTAGIIGSGFLSAHLLSRGRAMGLGDAPVAFSLSLLVAPYAVAGLLLSFWIGALIGILILVLRRGGPTMGIEVPFVPFLALGYILAFFIEWNPLALL